MNVYLTLEYTSPFSTLNSLWGAAREHAYHPDHVILLTPDPASTQAKRLGTMLGCVQRALGKTPNVTFEAIDPLDLSGTRVIIRTLIKARKREGHKIAVDITAGRTIPKLALYQACLEEKPHHIYYLSVAGYDYRDQPYVLIPRRLQESKDLLGEVA